MYSGMGKGTSWAEVMSSNENQAHIPSLKASGS